MGTNKKKTKGTPDSIDVHVGQRLRVRRSLLGYSQEKVAEAIGLTFQQIQKYEKGLNRISAGRLYQFSQLLGVPVSYFFENVSKKSSQTAHGLADNEQEEFMSEDLMQSKETLDLVRAYYSIDDPEVRKNFVKHIKSIGSAITKSGK